MATAQRGEGGERMQHAGLVVGGHQADQRRTLRFGQSGVEGGGIEGSVRAHRENGRAGRGRAHRVVLGGADQQATPGAESGDRQRVALGAAGGEHQPGRIGAQAGGDSFARLFQHRPGGPAGGMHRGRVAGQRQRRQHGVTRLRAQRLAGIGVEIDQARTRAAHPARAPPMGLVSALPSLRGSCAIPLASLGPPRYRRATHVRLTRSVSGLVKHPSNRALYCPPPPSMETRVERTRDLRGL